jgi:hypothetical protein
MFGRARAQSRGDGRQQTRLDPVRWRPPGRGTLIRAAVVTALLSTAAAVVWSRPTGCPPPTAGAVSTSGVRVPGPVTSGHTRAPGPGQSPGGRPTVPSGAVGVPVRLAEPAALSLVHPGDRVDLLRVSTADGRTTPVADGALVLGVTGADDPTAGGLLLALTPVEARRAVGTPELTRFAVLIRAAR